RAIRISGESIFFVRDSKENSESIPIHELYELYTKENIIKTTIAKEYISGRVQSPAVAILDQLKKTLQSHPVVALSISNNINSPRKTENNSSKNIKDETKFFVAFSEIIGHQYLLSKSINKPINSKQIFLSNNYIDYLFAQEINGCYLKILTDLQSNFEFSSDSLSHHIDGIVLNHPTLQNRIIEFDEEQHFTPARMDTLKFLPQILTNNYFSKYFDICTNKSYLNEFVLKKHRITNRLETVPSSFTEFTKWLKKSNEKTSGYICSKNGFDFLGGRIAQRAYYDCLRDTAHLSIKNRRFESPIRFAKKTFEDKEKANFIDISNERIIKLIIEMLKTEYKIIFNSD
ncbi:MAG: hypothetical protein KDC52_16575, partial [Ignavibacteriae bacterium]|nr:hypothetical protein [Ignavibacteriota bacterium]